MKLVLCSEGFSTPEIVATFAELCGKPERDISIAVINEAYAVEEGDKRWVLNNLNSVAQNFGEMELVNLLALPLGEIKKRVMRCDAIFVVGGHTDYLMHVFNKTGFTKLLPKLLETKVYVGSSAGSMVLGNRISAVAHKTIYGEINTYGTSKFLGLVDLALLPHLDSARFPGRSEAVQKVAKQYKGTLCGLCNDSALVVNGTEQKIIGSMPLMAVNGTVVMSPSPAINVG